VLWTISDAVGVDSPRGILPSCSTMDRDEPFSRDTHLYVQYAAHIMLTNSRLTNAIIWIRGGRGQIQGLSSLAGQEVKHLLPSLFLHCSPTSATMSLPLRTSSLEQRASPLIGLPPLLVPRGDSKNEMKTVDSPVPGLPPLMVPSVDQGTFFPLGRAINDVLYRLSRKVALQ
jgi:hypothetical protein